MVASLGTITVLFTVLPTGLPEKNILEESTFGLLQRIKERKEKVESDFKSNRNSQRELAAELQKEYGEGTINLETGEFIKPE